MNRSGGSNKYVRKVCTETTFFNRPFYKKTVTETIYPIPNEVSEEEKTVVNGSVGNQLVNVSGSLTKENKKKTKLPKSK